MLNRDGSLDSKHLHRVKHTANCFTELERQNLRDLFQCLCKSIKSRRYPSSEVNNGLKLAASFSGRQALCRELLGTKTESPYNLSLDHFVQDH